MTQPSESTVETLRQIELLKEGGEKSPQYVTNIPGEGRELMKSITRAEAEADLNNEELVEKPFPITYFYLHAVELRADSTGEMVRNVRVVLLDKEMHTVSFISAGVVDSLLKIIQTLGSQPFTDEPLNVRLQITKTSNKYKVMRLIVV